MCDYVSQFMLQKKHIDIYCIYKCVRVYIMLYHICYAGCYDEMVYLYWLLGSSWVCVCGLVVSLTIIMHMIAYSFGAFVGMVACVCDIHIHIYTYIFVCVNTSYMLVYVLQRIRFRYYVFFCVLVTIHMRYSGLTCNIFVYIYIYIYIYLFVSVITHQLWVCVCVVRVCSYVRESACVCVKRARGGDDDSPATQKHRWVKKKTNRN